MILVLILGIAGAALVAAGIVWVRNERVCHFRGALIERIGAAGRADIQRGAYSPMWRWDVFDAVPYERMIWQFWKPLRAFYSDMSFAEMGAPDLAEEEAVYCPHMRPGGWKSCPHCSGVNSAVPQSSEPEKEGD